MRASGILLHISSLPSPYGIGGLGRAAYEFIDFLEKAGQRYWQMLPINPTGYGDSPYQSFSVFAGNPYFIDLDVLCGQGLLTSAELHTVDFGAVDYEYLYKSRFAVLRTAFSRFDTSREDYHVFKQAAWLEDYALFMAIKDSLDGIPWSAWSEDIKNREPQAMAHYAHVLAQEVELYKFIQFEFFRQLEVLREYAHKKNISLIGDIPIYVASDSADVWANPGLFLLDKDNRPIKVAGCPPDAFSADGQLWGNPLYRWDEMKAQDYSWWVERIRRSMAIFDLLRIDHFRGFESYYAIPAGDKTAANGVWEKGPGMALFDALNNALGKQNIIAEDLGYVSDEVKALLTATGYPGMKVLQFAFDTREESDYLPHNYEKNSVVYTGTHDNDTVAGWCKTARAADVALAAEYLNIACEEDYPWAFIRTAWASVSNLAVAPLQDFLGLGSEARMNTPSTLAGNWRWRVDATALTDELAEKIARLTKLYGR